MNKSDNKVTEISRAKNRPTRTPLHKRKVLDAKPRQGYIRRWVNELHGAVSAFQEAGWSLVVGDEDQSENRVQDASQLDSVIRRVVNRDPNASAKTAVLMEIPEDLYKEDQADKAQRINEIEASYDPKKFQQHGSDYGTFRKT